MSKRPLTPPVLCMRPLKEKVWTSLMVAIILVSWTCTKLNRNSVIHRRTQHLGLIPPWFFFFSLRHWWLRATFLNQVIRNRLCLSEQTYPGLLESGPGCWHVFCVRAAVSRSQPAAHWRRIELIIEERGVTLPGVQFHLFPQEWWNRHCSQAVWRK